MIARLSHRLRVVTAFVLMRWGYGIVAATFIGSVALWLADIQPWGHILGVAAVMVAWFRYGVAVGVALGPNGVDAASSLRVSEVVAWLSHPVGASSRTPGAER